MFLFSFIASVIENLFLFLLLLQSLEYVSLFSFIASCFLLLLQLGNLSLFSSVYCFSQSDFFLVFFYCFSHWILFLCNRESPVLLGNLSLFSSVYCFSQWDFFSCFLLLLQSLDFVSL